MPIMRALQPTTFSAKQVKLLSWWVPGSPYEHFNGIIAEGPIRSGKSASMSVGFVLSAMAATDGENHIMAGKTIKSFERNVLDQLIPTLESLGFTVHRKRSLNRIIVCDGSKINTFHIFGGTDESSQDLIQGLTAASVYFDEIALMPESFVNQAVGRCSAQGRIGNTVYLPKIWANCNPEGPSHWFKLEWVDRAEDKKLFHLKFRMTDNPGLSPGMIARYNSLYPSGPYRQRMILGNWALAEGMIYDNFGEDNEYDQLPEGAWWGGKHFVGVDYGTQNATVFLRCIEYKGIVYVDSEYYHSGAKGTQKTNLEYVTDLQAFISEDPKPKKIVIDPAAASFILECARAKLPVIQADNEVLEGIRHVMALVGSCKLKINRRCAHTLREMKGYSWDPKPTAKGREQPIKSNDHAPDALRYLCQTLIPNRYLHAAA